jgi:hypothetical protein
MMKIFVSDDKKVAIAAIKGKLEAGKVGDVTTAEARKAFAIEMPNVVGALKAVAEASANAQQAMFTKVAQTYEAVPFGSKLTNMVVDVCEASPGATNAPMCAAFKDVAKSREK